MVAKSSRHQPNPVVTMINRPTQPQRGSAHRVHPSLPLYLFALLVGLLLSGCGALQDTVDPFRLVHSAEDNADYEISSAKTDNDRGRYDQAIARTEKATKYSPSYGPAWYWLGVSYFNNHQNDEAITAFKRAIDLKSKLSNAECASSYYLLGRAYRQKKQFDLAIQSLENAVYKAPQDSSVINELGNAYHESGKVDLAITTYERAAKLNPTDSTIKNNLQNANNLKRDRRKPMLALIDRGRTNENGGHLREALDQYLSALQMMEPNDGERSDLLQRIILLVRKLDAPPAVPEDAKRHAVFAVTAAKEAKEPTDYDKAIAEYQKAIQAAPWLADLHYNLALIAEQRGNYNLAASSLKWYLLAAPNAPDASKVELKLYELEYKARTNTK